MKRFTPPYPAPPAKKPYFLKRFYKGLKSWTDTLYARSYNAKLGETKFPRFTAFTVGEPEFVDEILYNKNKNFVKHNALVKLLSPVIGECILVTNEEQWKRKRHMMGAAFGHTNLNRAFPLMLEAANDCVERIRNATKITDEISVDDEMTHVTGDVIFHTIFSESFSKEKAEEVFDAFHCYQHSAHRAYLLGLYYLPSFLSMFSARRHAKRIHKVLSPSIEARYNAYHRDNSFADNKEEKDILDALLKAKDPETGQGFSLEELKYQIYCVFLAGHETTASALSWALYLIASRPDTQKRLKEEIGKEEITLERLKGFHHLKNVFQETLRLYPPVSFFMRQAKCPFTYRGKKIRSKDSLTISPWLIQRSSNHWNNPHEFDPDRFDKNNEEAQSRCPVHKKSDKQGYFPFGKGERICIGAGFAMQESMIILARILQEFDLKYTRNSQPEVLSRVTTRSKDRIFIHFS